MNNPRAVRNPAPFYCDQQVHRATGRFSSFGQCSRRGVVEEDGHKWCRQHAPSAVKAAASVAETVGYLRDRATDTAYRQRTAQLAAAVALADVSDADAERLPEVLRRAREELVDAMRARAAADAAYTAAGGPEPGVTSMLGIARRGCLPVGEN